MICNPSSSNDEWLCSYRSGFLYVSSINSFFHFILHKVLFFAVPLGSLAAIARRSLKTSVARSLFGGYQCINTNNYMLFTS